MSTSINIILLIVCVIGLIFFIRKMRLQQKTIIKHTQEQNSDAQALPTKSRATDEVQSLSMEEKIDLSWAFLTEITDRVLNYFSKEDQDKLQKTGQLLVQSGATYQHNVETEVQATLNLGRAKEKEQNQLSM